MKAVTKRMMTIAYLKHCRLVPLLSSQVDWERLYKELDILHFSSLPLIMMLLLVPGWKLHFHGRCHSLSQSLL